MVFSIGFSSLKIPKSNRCKKPTMSIGQIVLYMSNVTCSQIGPCHFDWYNDQQND